MAIATIHASRGKMTDTAFSTTNQELEDAGRSGRSGARTVDEEERQVEIHKANKSLTDDKEDSDIRVRVAEMLKDNLELPAPVSFPTGPSPPYGSLPNNTGNGDGQFPHQKTIFNPTAFGFLFGPAAAAADPHALPPLSRAAAIRTPVVHPFICHNSTDLIHHLDYALINNIPAV
ncbi:hypothetical protein VE00_08663 [Pseudogymnoascus sp. WSF 3629]|nr:hypothetical protein VE00_08663 [Pseudogymnoascus sp. WSF 3629]